MSELNVSVRYLKNVGPARARILNSLGINTLGDLLYYFPRKYIDRTTIKPLSQAAPGEKNTFIGKVIATEELNPRRNMKIFKAILKDKSGFLTAVWFNNKYLKKQITQHSELMVTGKVEYRYGSRQINVEEFEILSEQNEDSVNFGRIVPVYPGISDKIPQKTFRAIIKNALENYLQCVNEVLPSEIITKNNFPSRAVAIKTMHFPDSEVNFENARKRLAFEELFFLQLALQYNRTMQKEKKGKKHAPDYQLRKLFLSTLPFELTDAQKKVISEIDEDMASPYPMARLVQGDVGSGKTVIAQLTVLNAVANNSQAVVMAPTEILAEQHFQGLFENFKGLGYRSCLLTGTMRKKERQELLSAISNGEIHIIIGTHAVFQNDVIYHNLGLVVIDEQHRFGVRQRMALEQKGVNPDLLVMTATPIPRTLAMTLYGDLEVSVLDQLPPGRKPIKTYHVGYDKISRLHGFLKREIESGRQCYYVCPLVEESEKIDLEAATTLFEELKNTFTGISIGLLHGRLPQSEKEQVMQRFKKGEIKILVATTVVEVGVNVPNASVMVVKDADRFGLAQLHQLRGRIGRGEHQSFCILLAEPKNPEAYKRMKIMESSQDGFLIAEEDLKLRGPGEFLGTRQHGLSEIKIADLLKDIDLMAKARQEAKSILEKDSKLLAEEHAMLYLNIKDKYFSFA